MEFLLDAVEARVLGSLIEKEITTPEYYPLSVNALLNACNQKSSRDPVMQLDEVVVRQALSHLEELNLAGRVHDSRVIKYEHNVRQILNLDRPGIAVLCLLLLRGPQTAGELRNRSERLYSFADIAAVQSVLDRMSGAAAGTEADVKARSALVTQLSRRPGEKESRYAHLLSGEPAAPALQSEPARESTVATPLQLRRLEAELAELRAAVDTVLAPLQKLEGAPPEHNS